MRIATAVVAASERMHLRLAWFGVGGPFGTKLDEASVDSYSAYVFTSKRREEWR
jgi:hypothetical protein